MYKSTIELFVEYVQKIYVDKIYFVKYNIFKEKKII